LKKKISLASYST